MEIEGGTFSTGITPAYAGNTSRKITSTLLQKDHPRLRGEHSFFLSPKQSFLGSPPPTRGTLCIINALIFNAGITPAYAGNTIALSVNTLMPWDHPRLRGEHLSSTVKVSPTSGSPPPTRGTHSAFMVLYLCRRITPAYAGNTNYCA